MRMIWLAIGLLAAAVTPIDAGTAEYRLEFFDPPAGMRVQYAMCHLNDAGQVVFTATDAANRNHAFLRSPDGSLTDLGFLSGRDYVDAYGISNSGVVVGDGWNPAWLRPFVWKPGVGIQQLPTLSSSSGGRALGVNSAGTIVGHVESPTTGRVQACRWTPDGQLTLLPSLGGTYGSAGDINEAGAIAGMSVTSTGHDYAVVWNPDGSIRNLGALSGHAHSEASAINNPGQVVGYSYGASTEDRCPTLWNPNGTMVRLIKGETEMGDCTDINDKGQVIGYWGDGSSNYHSFIYSPDTGTVELSIPSVRGPWVYGINNHGTMCGHGFDQQAGRSRWFLYGPVPEPSSLCGIIFGIACATPLRARLARRRRGREGRDQA